MSAGIIAVEVIVLAMQTVILIAILSIGRAWWKNFRILTDRIDAIEDAKKK